MNNDDIISQRSNARSVQSYQVGARSQSLDPTSSFYVHSMNNTSNTINGRQSKIDKYHPQRGGLMEIGEHGDAQDEYDRSRQADSRFR